MTTGDLPDPRTLLAETDWNTLGADSAERLDDQSPDLVSFTPVALAALGSGDSDAVTRALNHLSDVLLHQESLYGETPIAALYVAALLADRDSQEALTPEWEAGRRPLRAKLLDWLAAVAHTVSDAAEEHRAQWGGSWASLPQAREVRASRPALFQGVSACLPAPDRRVREAALAAAIPLLDAPELVHHRPVVAPALRRELAASSEQNYRFAAIRGLRAWGEDTTTLQAHTELVEFERQAEEWRASFHDPHTADEPPF
ncbi:hypothetical protein E1264_34795 [Actinomadura sp. KC216]|uniref:hypothetical protein n=1 Tax=Actinomadura sp. KC216 TaxID=2530370 RepID=UPI00104F189D|nr:hypothetical protein [Actinomadura sp. KC216]TDB79931.1 hypothetical protein E1264_34795 [Actinomadura sp. KC216]